MTRSSPLLALMAAASLACPPHSPSIDAERLKSVLVLSELVRGEAGRGQKERGRRTVDKGCGCYPKRSERFLASLIRSLQVARMKTNLIDIGS